MTRPVLRSMSRSMISCSYVVARIDVRGAIFWVRRSRQRHGWLFLRRAPHCIVFQLRSSTARAPSLLVAASSIATRSLVDPLTRRSASKSVRRESNNRSIVPRSMHEPRLGLVLLLVLVGSHTLRSTRPAGTSARVGMNSIN